ncbi:MAG: hypothetical protein ABJB11_01670 [Ferruginibacter sp.]
MKKIIFTLILFIAFNNSRAQSSIAPDSTLYPGKVTVFRDSRMETLTKKVVEYNEMMASSPRIGRGYRLMVLNTTDRNLAMNLRASLLQLFPDQKVYMSFQPPYIKLKFGNFVEKSEADEFKKDIIQAKLVNSNIYLVPENIEVKPDKTKE